MPEPESTKLNGTLAQYTSIEEVYVVQWILSSDVKLLILEKKSAKELGRC
jgi:hypothetical protein